MIETSILAITDKYALSGIFCLAAIPCLIIALIPFKKGLIAGSGTNFIFLLLVLLCSSSPEDKGYDSCIPTGTDYGYIANESRTKWLRRGEANLDEPNSIFLILDESTVSVLDDEELFIPAEELKVVDGWLVMKSTGQRPEEDDYYRYDLVYPSTNVPSSEGGGVVHPRKQDTFKRRRGYCAQPQTRSASGSPEPSESVHCYSS